jgi:Asp-tRNA(Asn)/Glu-tRNA(Gln) amidotransferase A subunit family amidase
MANRRHDGHETRHPPYLENKSLATVAGYPAIIISVGFGPNRKPYGIKFISKAFSEIILLKQFALNKKRRKSGTRPGWNE